MEKQPSFLITILARGGSKRIPRKNIKNFLNIPIINYPLNLVKEKFPNIPIHISSEDDEILEYVESIGNIVDFKRPKNLAEDTTPSLDVINYIYEEYKKRKKDFTHIINIPATSVFCTEKIIKDSINLSIDNPEKIVLPVKEFNVPLETSYKFNPNKKILYPMDIDKFSKNTQDFSKNVYDAGVLAIIPTRVLNKINNPKFIASNLIGLKIENLVIDIDNQNDWHLSEKIYKSLNT